MMEIDDGFFERTWEELAMLDLKAHPERGAVTLAVRVQPRASKTEVAGVMEKAQGGC